MEVLFFIFLFFIILILEMIDKLNHKLNIILRDLKIMRKQNGQKKVKNK